VLISGKPVKGRVILAHGAGAGMRSEFMRVIADKLVLQGFEVVRFEFPYMQKITATGKRRPPDPMPKLLAYFAEIIAQFDEDVPLFLAGKSMGGRVASMLFEASSASGCFVFGYPFHPAGKPDKLRVDHLFEITKPLHIFQGTRDRMGSFSEVTQYNLPPSVSVHWLEDGDHDLKPRKISGFLHDDHLNYSVSFIKDWVR
jgi:predicted alpha/beta-hydrolase family hydrolase